MEAQYINKVYIVIRIEKNSNFIILKERFNNHFNERKKKKGLNLCGIKEGPFIFNSIK